MKKEDKSVLRNIWPVGCGWAGLAVGLLGLGCQAKLVDLDGLPCGQGACVQGYVCHPETVRCVLPVTTDCVAAAGVCPSRTRAGDACPHPGSFLPCLDGATDCASGCRTCQESGTWSACSGTGCETCTTFYRDDDRDGVGVTADSECLCAGLNPYDALAADDCDDEPATGASCVTGCVMFYPDVDGDQFGSGTGVLACVAPSGRAAVSGDCDDADQYAFPGAAQAESATSCMQDTDDDGYGNQSPNSGVIPGTDCDDATPHCRQSCTDGDGDSFCLGVDCYDDDLNCTLDCTACPPKSLSLSVLTALPTAGQPVTLEIDLGSYTRDVTAEITCGTPTSVLLGPEDFTTCLPSGWTANSSTCLTVPAAPFDDAACSSAGGFLRLGTNPQAKLQRTQAVNAAGYQASVKFRAAVAVADTPGAGDVLQVESECTSPVTTHAIHDVAPAQLDGANACALQQVMLSEVNCAALLVRFLWPNRSVDVGLDDISIEGKLSMSAVSRSAPGKYTAAFTPLQAGSVNVTCTWNAGSPAEQADTVLVNVQ